MQNCRLIVNYLPQLLTDEEFYYIFNSFGPIESARVIRDRITGYSHGYGFITFRFHKDAAKAVERANGLIIQDKRLKVSYARPPGDDRKETNLYISNLPLTFTGFNLKNLFSMYGNIIQYNLLRDKKSGMPRGVAFVRYERNCEAHAAMQSLNGVTLKGSQSPLAIKIAEDHTTSKTFFHAGRQWHITLQSAKAESSYYKSWSSCESRVSNQSYSTVL